MHKISPAVWLLSNVLPFSMIFAAESKDSDVCAFRIEVFDRTGGGVRAPVEVFDLGRSSESKVFFTDGEGKGEICDLKARSVSVRVGGSNCGSVMIENMWWTLRAPLRIKTFYSPCAHGGPIGGCIPIVRLQNELGGHVVGDVFMDGRWYNSDKKGRVELILPMNKQTEIRARTQDSEEVRKTVICDGRKVLDDIVVTVNRK